ncbi:MAG: carbamoyltransferase HypF [Spirochaetota bacterium]
MKEHRIIRIRGIVQGVGFRPHVYRLAHAHGLAGSVHNDTEGVLIHLEGDAGSIDQLVTSLQNDPPPLADIQSVTSSTHTPRGLTTFSIEQSTSSSIRSAFIPPDAAVCDACMNEFFNPDDRRHQYPFITCTHCGPRFSIIFDIPYDRPGTSMKDFPMCPRCEKEYRDPRDRRFHTQPNACPVCGPRVFLADSNGTPVTENIDETIQHTLRLLKEGRVVAIKGVGGFHLAADATNDHPVELLRQRKGRPFKPFALMTGSIETADKLTRVSPAEEKLLLSRERPIVLLKDRGEGHVSPLVSPGITWTGIMLPYTPFQHLLFEKDPDLVLVMTSGNVTDEPIIYRNEDALTRLSSFADYFVMYNREITAHSDDSVMYVVDEQPFFIRRSRGFVPAPFLTEHSQSQILATGGDLKNSFALAKDNYIILSQYLGDLETPWGNQLYRSAIDHFKKIFDFRPGTVVSDLHPGYYTTMFADELSQQGITHMKVQHHHAHIAANLEEHNVNQPVIGIAYDGTGYGTDSTLWGSEFLIADKKNFTRAAHYENFPLPGGESAIRDVWKIGLSLLRSALGDDRDVYATMEQRNMVLEILEHNINSPLTCSIGRIFDGVSSILGIRHHVTAEAEAAQLLEEAAHKGSGTMGESTLIPVSDENDTMIINTPNLIRMVYDLHQNGHSITDTALFFHQCIAATTVHVATMLREKYKINTVTLSGGVFHNRLLLSLISSGLRKKAFDILMPRKIPFNDGCMAVGQIAIARELLK